VILLDTHAAVWFVTNDKSLGNRSRKAAVTALKEDQLTISAISFWEIALLIAKRRLESLDSATEIREQILNSGIGELPITGALAVLAIEIKNLHGDPADRFIAATAIAHDATLMTADTRLLRWRHAVRRQNAAK
jgi:PIN domain nuclease of toxin-antitoxin system